MREIRRSALVPATARRMFEIINDIAAYPGFVPGCISASVLEETGALQRARLVVGSGLLKTSFVTRNRLQPHTAIHMELEEGPFRSLDGVWQLTALFQPQTGAEIGCRVDLELRFELKGGLAGMTMGPLLERTASALVDAFVSKAREEHRLAVQAAP